MSLQFSYRHLYYFWVVAKEGGMSRGAERLGMAIQTVSAQVRELERALGKTLLKPAGRGLALTEAGRTAMQQAEHIFALGMQLPELVRQAGDVPRLRLNVGIGDSVPKLVVHSLLSPVLNEPHLRLQLMVGEFDTLLADLALHRLDLVLADRAPPPNPNLRLYSQVIGQSTLSWYGPTRWANIAAAGFPASLAQVPMLLPTAHAAMRQLLDQWLERQGIQPDCVGEFEDSALLKAFGAGGMGIFPAADIVQEELLTRYGVIRIGPCQGVLEQFHAIGTDKRLIHPLIRRLLKRD